MNQITDWQVDSVAKAIADCHNPGSFELYPDNWLPEMGEIYRRRPSTPAGPWLPVDGEKP